MGLATASDHGVMIPAFRPKKGGGATNSRMATGVIVARGQAVKGHRGTILETSVAWLACEEPRFVVMFESWLLELGTLML